MSGKTDRELIDEWLRENEPTKCPPAYLVPVGGSTGSAFHISDTHLDSYRPLPLGHWSDR